MPTSRQVPLGKLPASSDAPDAASAAPHGVNEESIEVIERSLAAMRRDQTKRRLQRRAERERHGHEHKHLHERERGRQERGDRGNAAKFRLLDALASGAGGAPAGATHSLSISELGEAIGVDQPRASRLVSAAIDEDLVRRRADPRDARRSVIELTGAGKRIIEQAHTTRRAAVSEALAGFSPAEAEQLATLLHRFVEAWPRENEKE